MRETTYVADGAYTIRLRIDKLRAEGRRRAWRNDQQMAEGIGISKSNLSRLLNPDETERQSPGPAFIAAVLTAFPEHRFEDFFEAVAPRPLRRTA